MFDLRYSERVLADFQEILDYIAADNPARARSYVGELRGYCRRIARQPKAYRMREDLGEGIRIAVYNRYLILFSERDGTVFIERVVHGSRDLDILMTDT